LLIVHEKKSVVVIGLEFEYVSLLISTFGSMRCPFDGVCFEISQIVLLPIRALT